MVCWEPRAGKVTGPMRTCRQSEIITKRRQICSSTLTFHAQCYSIFPSGANSYAPRRMSTVKALPDPSSAYCGHTKKKRRINFVTSSNRTYGQQIQGPCRNNCRMGAHNQSINQSMLLEDLSARKYSRISSHQELCLSMRPRKIQRLLGFNFAIEINFEHATAGLDRGKSEIQPFPLVTNHCEHKYFSWLFWNVFVPIKNTSHLLFPHFLWDKIPRDSYLFPQLGDSYKGRWFSSKMESDGVANATLRMLFGSWSFLNLPFVVLTFGKINPPLRWILYRKQTSSPWTPSFGKGGGWRLFRQGPRKNLFYGTGNFQSKTRKPCIRPERPTIRNPGTRSRGGSFPRSSSRRFLPKVSTWREGRPRRCRQSSKIPERKRSNLTKPNCLYSASYFEIFHSQPTPSNIHFAN